ncbi:MAG: hypothetical protein OEL88_00170 [Sterolibacteriaceae bacterium MAG5]|nr:hypothetical protein [Candidatus Nitricoxidireducens bremensis]
MSLAAWLRDGLARFSAAVPPFILGETPALILDVDITGVDAQRDRVTGIALLPVSGTRFRLADLDYLQLPPADGAPADPADFGRQFDRLLAATGDVPIIVFNVNFVRHMLDRTLGALGLPRLGGRWLDVRAMLEGVYGKEMGQVESLASWQQRLGVPVLAEHSAVADVFATAQLFAILVGRCEELDLRTMDDVMDAEKSRRWLRGD